MIASSSVGGSGKAAVGLVECLLDCLSSHVRDTGHTIPHESTNIAEVVQLQPTSSSWEETNSRINAELEHARNNVFFSLILPCKLQCMTDGLGPSNRSRYGIDVDLRWQAWPYFRGGSSSPPSCSHNLYPTDLWCPGPPRMIGFLASCDEPPNVATEVGY